MIFKEKYNNSLGIMCKANDDLCLLVTNYLMDLPLDVVEKIQEGENFDVLRMDIDVWYADVFEYAALQSNLNNRTTLLRMYPFNESNINRLTVIKNLSASNIDSFVDDIYELAQIQYFEEGDENVTSYSAFLSKTINNEYRITLIKAFSPIEDLFDPEQYVINDYTDTFISEEELMKILNVYKSNKIR